MKILQIGIGRWGANHLRVLSDLSVELYVAELSSEKRQECQRQGLREDRVSEHFQDFVDEVSAVDVVTPAPTHYPLCKELLQRGKDIFIEKPITETSAEAAELKALADETGAVLQVGHIFRYDPATDYIRTCLDSGELGTILTLSGSFSGFKRPRDDGGVAISDAIHFIDLFNYLMGSPPRKVLARCEEVLGRGMDDQCWIWMDYDGVPAVVEANYFAPEKSRAIRITGEKATLMCDFTSVQDKVKIHRNQHVLDANTWKTVSGEVISKEIVVSEPLHLELKDFIRCIGDRSRPRATAQAGVDSLRVFEAARQSHSEGRIVVINP